MRFFSVLALAFAMALPAHAAVHEPAFLQAVVESVRETEGNGIQPVLVFDLDDTLLNTRERTQRILREFLAAPGVRERYPAEAARLEGLELHEIRYVLAETFAGRGIVNAEMLAEAGAFWKTRFFSNEYCARDRENSGAVNYVQQLAAAGALIVYLTGRDDPSMGIGTRENLQALGFPTGPSQSVLLMKPRAEIDDFIFKRDAIARIRILGRVVGVFENEPANLNLLHAAFPEAIAIFLDTIHSPKPDVPASDTHWVADFQHSRGDRLTARRIPATASSALPR